MALMKTPLGTVTEVMISQLEVKGLQVIPSAAHCPELHTLTHVWLPAKEDQLFGHEAHSPRVVSFMYVPAGQGLHSDMDVAPGGPKKPGGQEVHVFFCVMYVLGGHWEAHAVDPLNEYGLDGGHS